MPRSRRVIPTLSPPSLPPKAPITSIQPAYILKDVATILHTSPQFVTRLIQEGLLRAYRLGLTGDKYGALIVLDEDLRRYLKDFAGYNV